VARLSFRQIETKSFAPNTAWIKARAECDLAFLFAACFVFAASLPDGENQIRFLPRLDYDDYLSLVMAADVQLDTVRFGGGMTSYEALAVGTPVVTLPSPYLRGRITLGLYKQMQVLDCVAQSPQEYCELAVRLGTDAGYREMIRAKILSANGVLFENDQGIRELEQFLHHVVEAAR
jgi:protein O-GlcNAc transferase